MKYRYLVLRYLLLITRRSGYLTRFQLFSYFIPPSSFYAYDSYDRFHIRYRKKTFLLIKNCFVFFCMFDSHHVIKVFRQDINRLANDKVHYTAIAKKVLEKSRKMNSCNTRSDNIYNKPHLGTIYKR